MPGNTAFTIAKSPATCGAAKEVPLKESYPPPGTAVLIEVPGATSMGPLKVFGGAALENAENTPVPLSDAATFIDWDIHAGKPIAVRLLKFPVEMTVATLKLFN